MEYILLQKRYLHFAEACLQKNTKLNTIIVQEKQNWSSFHEKPHDNWINYANIDLRHQYGISVAEEQMSLLAPHPLWWGARRDGCFCSLPFLSHFLWPYYDMKSQRPSKNTMTDNIVLAKVINNLHFIDRSGLTEGKCNLRERRIKIR